MEKEKIFVVSLIRDGRKFYLAKGYPIEREGFFVESLKDAAFYTQKHWARLACSGYKGAIVESIDLYNGEVLK